MNQKMFVWAGRKYFVSIRFLMNILVCVKQVPDMESLTVSEDDKGRADLDEATAYHMNQCDDCAVEAAIQIRETFSSARPVRVDVITVGPDRTIDVLRRAVGMGAQCGIHLKSQGDTDIGPEAVAAGIARYVRSHTYDLILTGSMSEDGMHGQVGPRLAGHLGWPCAIHVVGMQYDDAGGNIVVEKEIESGMRVKLKIRLPAVLAVQSGIHRPRYPSLSNLLRANRQTMASIALSTSQDVATIPECLGVFIPQRSRSGTVLEGATEEKAGKLITILRKKAFLTDDVQPL
jgi:electron transfer flavoprotein beta subunit